LTSLSASARAKASFWLSIRAETFLFTGCKSVFPWWITLDLVLLLAFAFAFALALPLAFALVFGSALAFAFGTFSEYFLA
jgi:hypothetical protein